MTEPPLILVVEDDADIREALGEVLSEEGYGLAFASDGLEALAYLASSPRPALILLDWMMPRCDGTAFRIAQLADPGLADIPVILLTADGHGEERARRLGAAGFLRKPVGLEKLTSTLADHCRPPGPHRAPS